MCADSGAYMANLKSCANCKGNQLKIVNKIVVLESEVEITTYEHICSTCQHKISSHNHKFWVEGDYQEYEMECLLCGTGEDSISILPIDPRKMSGLLM